jgi:hypothetical protein
MRIRAVCGRGGARTVRRRTQAVRCRALSHFKFIKKSYPPRDFLAASFATLVFLMMNI